MRLSGQADNLISFWFDLFVIRETYNRYILEITVFVCGALVMIFEIIGSRILSPFIGTSTYVWTSLIGIILGALSLGYWLGGRIADRRPDKKVLGSVILAAGALVAATVLIKEVFLSSVGSAAIGLELKAVIASLVLFGPASVCLGIVTPFAVRLKMTSLDNTGQTVGRLYALSTIGSIVGTFVAGFLLIPFVGSVRTLYMIAGTLMALSFLVGAGPFTSKNIAAVLLLVLGISASEGVNYLLRTQSDLYDIDTEYSRVQVFRSQDPKTGKPIRALATDPYFVQSAAFPDSEELVLEYSNFYHLIRHFRPQFEKTLVIGGAGYSFPKEYLRAYPHAQIDVAEIDPGMTSIARRFFDLKEDPRLRIFHEDARMYINRTGSAEYDAILMDAFGSLFSVPHHLTTVEAVRELSRVLKEDGVAIFNLGSAITGPSSGFLQSEMRTYKAVFPQVFLFKVSQEYTDDRLQNLIIVAYKSKLQPGLESGDPVIASLLERRYSAEVPLEKAVLTDDLSPVEYYNSIAQNIYLTNRR
jgi:spermidine synthase